MINVKKSHLSAMMQLKLLQQLLFFFLLFSHLALSKTLHFNHYAESDGLTTTAIRAIVQDKTGYIWVGTKKGLFKFDSHRFIKQPLPNNPESIINHLFVDQQSRIWVGTEQNGLYVLVDGNWHAIPFSTIKDNVKVLTIEQSSDLTIWVGTNHGLKHFSEQKQQLLAHPTIHQHIKTIISTKDNRLWFGTKGQLNSYDIDKKQLTYYDRTIYPDATIHDIQPYQQQLWIGTSQGLVLFDLNQKTFSTGPKSIPNTRILSIVQQLDDLWIATIDQGIFQLDDQNNVHNHKYYDGPNSLSDKYIYTLYLANDNNLWIGNFYNGLNQLDLDSLAFHHETIEAKSLSCATSTMIYHISQQDKQTLWLATSQDVIRYNPQTQDCHNLTDTPTPFFIYHIRQKANTLWLSTSDGLKHYITTTNEMLDTPFDAVTYFTFENKDKTYLATTKGLFVYTDQQSPPQIIPSSKYLRIINKKSGPDGTIYLLTSTGLKLLNDDQLQSFMFLDQQYQNTSFSTVFISQSNHIYLALHDQLLQFNDQGQLLKKHDIGNNTIKGFKIINILADDQHSLWLATDKGLLNYNTTNETTTALRSIDAYNTFFPRSAYRSNSGRMYFGHSNGLLHFDPNNINLTTSEPIVVIQSMRLLNQDVQVNQQLPSGFSINKPINELDEITLSHKDYIIDFEFTNLDYDQISDGHYAHRLRGLNDDWVVRDGQVRQATYTNLAPGKYTFEVKASNNQGSWSATKKIHINVLPAPWFTWWAFTLYGLLLFGMIYWYWHKKNRDNIRITKMLKAQVKQRTQDLEVQKQTVEHLLVKKNEMFANVSHEFRTPLTLILGPINQLLKTPRHIDEVSSLKMVNRNANRLLTMIEQLLMLAKITGAEKIPHIPQLIHHQVLSIFEIFLPLAQEKGITLRLVNNNEAAINATENTIDTVLGNLLSNALKYTPTGGQVSVSSHTHNGKVCIEVTDTGCGLNKQQQQEIFNRFKRLDTHANIDGVGIGLSVVEEILKINNGHLAIISEPGQGSTFTVTFEGIETTGINNQHNQYNVVSQLANNALLESEKTNTEILPIHRKTQETVLIIEDNDDMRHHIAQSIGTHFNCLTAERGKTGIALAIEHIPDIIICDVMMPEMDGFKVSRIIRSDTRTSHIPLILLTALHDKQSRIKGWREHVDAYLTKPFDADELLLQLNNILVIRNILKKKTSHFVKAGKKTPENIDLPKKDKDFVDKANDVIAKNYNNPLYQRKQLASTMAVSEKQLQRKLKALIDKNPMELLREYRLQVASDKLKEGYQVSLISDECGFNSLSHFSRCFKAHYGVSPKIYQQTCNNQNKKK